MSLWASHSAEAGDNTIMSNPLLEIQKHGQSAWLDYIHRDELENGELQRRIDEEGVLGVTSNPSIFQKAIGDSDTYDDAILTILDLEAQDIYERLAIEDIRGATDLFRPIYDGSGGGDGYVSLEVSPLLARDTQGTIDEAKRLYQTVDRPNLMIKIPATPEGLPAIEEVIASGINVNVTLIFAINNYEAVAEAFIRGLERRREAGQDITRVASVASFFLSRIDSMVDQILENNIRAAQEKQDNARAESNRALLGQAAVASAKMAYRSFQQIFDGERFAELRGAGAKAQRPLWASTSAKNPAYPDTIYVDNLIGDRTVNTLPPATLAAFKDHGRVARTIDRDLGHFLPPDEVMDRLLEAGVDLGDVTARLQDDGVDAFIDSFRTLITQVAEKRAILQQGIIERSRLALGEYQDAVDAAIQELDASDANARIWGKDGTLWKTDAATAAAIVNRLGWLDVEGSVDRERLQSLQDSVKGSGIQHVALLGMGGSSLAAETLADAFGAQAGFPRLITLDSTDPERIRSLEASIDLERTLFIVASKSGGTVETLALHHYFWQRTGAAADQFIVITDPGSQLETMARRAGCRDIFLNPADIGGRYSALSYFGMVPAALIGLDLPGLWASADAMRSANGESIPAKAHPGLLLGAVIGALAKEGRDKVTIHPSASLASFGKWAEQLLAESLGKEGKGALPVVGASPGSADDYGNDRLFVYLRVDNDSDVADADAAMRALMEAGHPLVTIRLPDTLSMAGEFFRWEYAAAAAGALLAVNPFDEPNVTEAKDATKALLRSYQESGALPAQMPDLESENLALYSDAATLAALKERCAAGSHDSGDISELIAAQIMSAREGDYFALLVYLDASDQEWALLRRIQGRLRSLTRRAVTIGVGPRYLHSTGQYHKGGGDNGIFWQLTADPAPDLSIPGLDYSFGALFAAQAAGDLQALQSHGRRVIRIHLSGDRSGSLEALLRAIDLAESRAD